MKKLFALFRILFDSTYGISQLKYKVSKNKKELVKPIALMAVIIFSFMPLIGGYTAYMFFSYESLLMIGHQGAIITVGVITSSFLVLFFGFFYVISTFYFSGDMDHLVTLPLKPFHILGAKFGVVLIGEYLLELPFVLPPIIIYGLRSGAGLLYWIYSAVAVLVIPVIPLCIVSILSIFVMKVTNVGKKKDLFRIIGGVIALFFMLGVQMYIQSTAAGDPEKLQNLLFSQNGLINIISRAFPPAGWVSMGLLGYEGINGLYMMAIFIGVSIAALFIFGYMGEKLYFGGYLGSQEAESKRKRLDEGEFVRQVAVRSKVSSIFWREFKILNRVPVFFLNCVLPVVLIPFIFVMMYFTSGGQVLGELTPLIKTPGGGYTATLIIAGIGVFTGAASMVAPTSLSREGGQFFISKYIPVSPKEQILGKMRHAAVLLFAGDLLAVGTIGFMLKIPPVNMVISFLLSTLAMIPVIQIGLLIDLFRPLLSWDNPQKAVKQNLNGVISMLLNIIWPGTILFAVGIAISNHILSYSIIAIIFIVLGAILQKVLMSYGTKRYGEIEA